MPPFPLLTSSYHLISINRERKQKARTLPLLLLFLLFNPFAITISWYSLSPVSLVSHWLPCFLLIYSRFVNSNSSVLAFVFYGASHFVFISMFLSRCLFVSFIVVVVVVVVYLRCQRPLPKSMSFNHLSWPASLNSSCKNSEMSPVFIVCGSSFRKPL